MLKKSVLILAALLLWQAAVVQAAEIILVTEEIDWDLDGLRDDHSLESFLVSEGHRVDIRPDYWKVLTPDKISELNAADLIIFSRLAWSDRYDEGNETNDWNSLTTPLLQMNSHFARNTRWKWVNSGTPAETPYIDALAVKPNHPVFRGVPLTLHDPAAPNGPLNVVQMVDPLVGTGLTSFIGSTDMGNGQLIAKPVGFEMGWIAEWDVGVEFFEGCGQYAGGRRMLFCAGTQEIQFFDYDIQEVITTAQGELNLTAEGLQMFRNAIAYLVAMEGVEQVDITAPGDLVQGVPNDGLNDGSSNFGWYNWERPDLAIDDNIETKYLHFKGETETTGFQVTPTSGATIVTGLTLTTANDFAARDPLAFELYGSNVSIDGPYELIASGYIVDFIQAVPWPRFTMNATPISFDNGVGYEHYQVLFPAVRDAGNANSMQIAEVELLGVPALGGANIILVTEAIDMDLDGLRDDHSFESFLISEGHSVDVRPEYWNVLTPEKIVELNAADLIIVSRLAWSSRYDDGNETTEWNSLMTPLLQMNSHFARNTRWNWVNSGTREPDGTSYIYALAVKPNHPVFWGVPLTTYDPTDPADSTLPIGVQMIDPLVGTGFTAFIDGTDMGNGQLIAKPLGFEMGWIAEWDSGVEFFDGAGQYAGGRRMLFCAGTREIRYYDDDRQEVIITAQGELNLTAEGLQMFRNAIAYLLEPEFAEGIVEPGILPE